MTECRADVNKLECGSSRRKVGQVICAKSKNNFCKFFVCADCYIYLRLQMLSQETTLMCLSRQLGEVSPSCRNEVLTLAELQVTSFVFWLQIYNKWLITIIYWSYLVRRGQGIWTNTPELVIFGQFFIFCFLWKGRGLPPRSRAVPCV